MRGEFSLPRQYALSCSCCSLLLLLIATLSFAQTSKSSAPPEAPKEVPSFDLTALDKTIDPCVDFYQFACGGWRKANPIPADQTRWGRFNELAERNREELHEILEQAKDPGQRSAIEAKVGDYYAACMDEAAIEARGLSAARADPGAGRRGPVEERLLPPARRERSASALPTLFRFGAAAGPPRLERQTIANLGQGGLSLPDRDDYLKDDAKSKEKREKYLEHVAEMLELAGEDRGGGEPTPRPCCGSRRPSPTRPWTASPCATRRTATTR